MAARKIDGWWYADFRVIGTRYRKRSPLNARPAAQEYEQFLRGEIAKSGSLKHIGPSDDANKPPTFAAFSDRWVQEYVIVNNKPSEQRAKAFALRLHLIPAFGVLRIDDITSRHVERLKGSLQGKGIGPKSINNYLSILRKCLTTAVDWEEMTNAPRIKPLQCAPPSFRFLNECETRILLEAAERGGMLHALMVTAVRTGLRACELLALRWEDVDLCTRQLCVRQAIVREHVGATKTYQIRYVPLVRDVVEVLAALPHLGAPVFHRKGQRIRYERAAEQLRRVCRLASIEPIGWHVLRHTFASHLAQRGVPLQFIQKLLGHSTIKMTERYAHLQATDLRQAITTLERPSHVWAADGQPISEMGLESLPPGGSLVPISSLNQAKSAVC